MVRLFASQYHIYVIRQPISCLFIFRGTLFDYLANTSFARQALGLSALPTVSIRAILPVFCGTITKGADGNPGFADLFRTFDIKSLPNKVCGTPDCGSVMFHDVSPPRLRIIKLLLERPYHDVCRVLVQVLVGILYCKPSESMQRTVRLSCWRTMAVHGYSKEGPWCWHSHLYRLRSPCC